MNDLLNKAILQEFWDKCGYHGEKRPRSHLSKGRTLVILRGIADTVTGRLSKASLRKMRAQFDQVKQKRHSFRSHSICFACHRPAEVRHHIIPLCNSGLNSKRNLISLCCKCHAKIHPWLANG